MLSNGGEGDSELDVLGIVGFHDNNARRFARVRKHYYSRRYEKTTFLLRDRLVFYLKYAP